MSKGEVRDRQEAALIRLNLSVCSLKPEDKGQAGERYREGQGEGREIPIP